MPINYIDIQLLFHLHDVSTYAAIISTGGIMPKSLQSLSPSEIKTLYMFPDDVAFGQLTADLIGANVIKAQNLIQSEAVITNKAQINSGVFNEILVGFRLYRHQQIRRKTRYQTRIRH